MGASGAFTFTNAIASGTSYSVSVSTQPSGQTCSVSNGSGTVSTAAVSNITISCRALIGKFLYVPNQSSNNLAVYSIDASTGALTASGSPVPTGTSPAYVSVDAAEKFLYVANTGSPAASPSISAYTINSTTGVLTQIAGSPFPLSVTTPPPIGSAGLSFPLIDSATKFAYVINRNDSKLHGARIDATTGALTEIAGMPMSGFGQILGSPVLDAAGKYMYVPYSQFDAGTMTGYVAVYQVDATTGVLTLAGSPVPTGGSGGITAQRVPSGKFLFVSNPYGPGLTGHGSVSVFSIDSSSGALTAVAGSPFDVGSPAQLVSLHPTKNFIYVLARENAPANGSLVIFQMDATTGVLTPTGAPNRTVGVTAGAFFVEPAGKFLTISNFGSNNIQVFGIDQTTGALTEAAGSPIAIGALSTALRWDPSWKFYYVSSAGSNTVSSYSLDATTGALTLVGSVAAGMNPGYPVVVGRQ